MPSNRVKYVIGIDAALRNVGYVVLDNVINVVASGNITTQAGWSEHGSIDHIVDTLFEVLERFLTPELIGSGSVAVFFEDINFSRAGDKTHARAKAVGVVQWVMRQMGMRLIYGVNNAAANSFLDGRFGLKPARRNSKAQKQHTMATLHRFMNFYTKNDNIADAFVVGLYGLAFLVEKQRLTVTALVRT